MKISSETLIDLTRVIAKLEASGPLPPEDLQAFERLPFRLQSFAEKTDIVRVGDRPKEVCLVLAGMTCRYKVLGAGQRQIFSFNIPGDLPDLHSLHLPLMDHSMSTLAPTTVAFIPLEAITTLIRSHPATGRALWRETLVDASIFRAWMAGLGRRSALQRIAHLICELFSRLSAAGLCKGGGFHLPVSQVELGDALGLSAVHVNRVLQELRRDELISTQGRHLTILDWGRLKTACEFDSAYLHLGRGSEPLQAMG